MGNERFWSLDDYQRFLQHPDVFARDWAADRIEHQYPGQAAENFVGLLTDSDTYLRIKAAQTIGGSGDPRYEPALGVLNDYTASEMDEWRATALADRAHFSRIIEGGPPEMLSAPSPRVESRTAPAQRRPPSGRRRRKKRRVQAKGRRKAQLRRGKRRKKRR